VVARQGAVTVFVEVKERRNADHGLGLEAVTWSKRRRMIRAATLYAASRGLSESALRFDVISVDGRTLRHEPGAFDADGS
jgi:putative endonuclease